MEVEERQDHRETEDEGDRKWPSMMMKLIRNVKPRSMIRKSIYMKRDLRPK